MSCSEGLRTMGVHGALACAAAHPIKSKHYYLATKADIVEQEQGAQPPNCCRTQAERAGVSVAMTPK